MIDKEFLEQISALHNELEDLERRIEKIENKSCKVVKDSVQGSSTSYPYIQHSCTIEGVEYPKTKRSRNIYKKQIKSKRAKLDKLINKLEYELNYIEDSEIRQIIRYRYEDDMNWIQIMHRMKYNSENTARMKLERFLEKIQNVRFVRKKHVKMLVSNKVVAHSWASPKLLQVFAKISSLCVRANVSWLFYYEKGR